MVERKIIQQCTRIWATNSEFRNEMDKFLSLNKAYDDAFRDMNIAVTKFDEGKPEMIKMIKEFYDETLKILQQMWEIAEKTKDKTLIEFVELEMEMLEQLYRKRYID